MSQPVSSGQIPTPLKQGVHRPITPTPAKQHTAARIARGKAQAAATTRGK